MTRLFPSAIAGSLPKPSWLAEPNTLWAPWRLDGVELEQAKIDATLLWIKLQEDAGMDVVADGERIRVAIALDHNGVRMHRLTLLSRSQGVLAHLEGRPDDQPVLGNLRGKILSGAHLLSTSMAGLLLVDAHDFSERARFPDTASSFIEHGVDDSVDLLRGSGGDIFVVSDAAIHLLRRRAATSATHRSTP